jgi:hypothetical protein
VAVSKLKKGRSLNREKKRALLELLSKEDGRCGLIKGKREGFFENTTTVVISNWVIGEVALADWVEPVSRWWTRAVDLVHGSTLRSLINEIERVCNCTAR